jgi:signal peptidase II
MKKFRYWLIIGIIVVDQLVKFLVRQDMYVGESIPIINGVLSITYVQNMGAAFNLFSGKGFILIAVPTISVAFAAWYMEHHPNAHKTLYISLCLIIAGGIGNLIDRLTLGFVTDMIDISWWPVFNIADVAVCIGAGFLILYTFCYMDSDNEAGV